MILNGAMAQQAEATVDLPRMARAATVVPNSVNDEQRTVDVVWTTGARVLRGFFERYYEELSLDPKSVRLKRLNNGAPLLNAHNAYDTADVVGVVESGSASVDGKRGIATVRFARAEDDPVADQIYRKVKDGILQNISVGYSVYRMEKIEDAADKVPVFRATDWEPCELSVVPMGADDGAGFRSSPERTSCVFLTPTRDEEMTMTMPPTGDTKAPPTTTTGESAAIIATRAASAARVEDAAARAAERAAAAEAAVEDERARIAGIRRIGIRSKLGETWSQSLIEAGTSVESARSAAFDQIVEHESGLQSDGHIRVGAGDDERDKWVRGASAWLLQRSGMGDMIKRAKAKMPAEFKDVDLDPAEFRGTTPMDLARQSLERQRISTRGVDRLRMVGMAFMHRSSMQTSSDFAILLENVLGKVLLGAYATQVNTWERFCKSDEVPDFRNSNRYRTGSLPSLDVILEHGEYRAGAIPDGSKYGISTQRLGKTFSLSQEMIVNDDMGAISQMAMLLGQSAMRTIETQVYALLLQNSGLGPTVGAAPFFDSTRGNVNTVGSALSVAGIDADRVFLRTQKDPNGQDFLDLQPAVLLVPDSLYGTANEINKAEFDFDNAGSNTTGKFQRPNRVRGLFEEVVSTPRLTGTRRYLFAAQRDAIVVAFLEGYGRGPRMDSQQGWRVDGVEWKVSLYAKPQVGDPKAALTNAGV